MNWDFLLLWKLLFNIFCNLSFLVSNDHIQHYNDGSFRSCAIWYFIHCMAQILELCLTYTSLFYIQYFSSMISKSVHRHMWCGKCHINVYVSTFCPITSYITYISKLFYHSNIFYSSFVRLSLSRTIVHLVIHLYLQNIKVHHNYSFHFSLLHILLLYNWYVQYLLIHWKTSRLMKFILCSMP